MDKPSGSGVFGRRHALFLCAGAAAFMASPAAARVGVTERRKLTFHHLHTGEKLSRVYWAKGEYLDDALEEISWLCRDFRTGDSRPIDRETLDIVYRVRQVLQTNKPVEIISAYRSPKTNAALAARSPGVARRSFHLQGRAIDIRVPGISSHTVSRAAASLRSGGVGLYSRSDFVHVDNGPWRRWGS
jgi:uncharacterized protein YcbK (DUF882 family)